MSDQPLDGQWTVYEDGYGILEWHPKHKDGVGMLCRCATQMEAEYTVAAHNASIAAERIQFQNAESLFQATCHKLEQQLATEREKVRIRTNQVKYEREQKELLREQLAAAVELLKTAIRCARGLGSVWRDKAKSVTNDWIAGRSDTPQLNTQCRILGALMQDADKEADALRKQLAEAIVAMRERNDLVEDVKFWKREHEAAHKRYIKEVVTCDQLREQHDAAVEALEKIDYFGDSLIAHNYDSQSPTVRELVEQCRAALAKMGEGK